MKVGVVSSDVRRPMATCALLYYLGRFGSGKTVLGNWCMESFVWKQNIDNDANDNNVNNSPPAIDASLLELLNGLMSCDLLVNTFMRSALCIITDRRNRQEQ